MKAVLIFLALTILCVEGLPSPISQSNSQSERSATNPEHQQSIPPTSRNDCPNCYAIEQPHVQTKEEQGKRDFLESLDKWYKIITILGVFVALGGVVALVAQVCLSRVSSQQELRAYVMLEDSSIFNVANPVPIYEGQVFDPTGHKLGIPLLGQRQLFA